jgi:hypothetical protein
LPSGARRDRIDTATNVALESGIVTTAADSFGCDKTTNPDDPESPQGQFKTGVVDFCCSVFFWQQVPFAGALDATGCWQHPHEQPPPLCPQQHAPA